MGSRYAQLAFDFLVVVAASTAAFLVLRDAGSLSQARQALTFAGVITVLIAAFAFRLWRQHASLERMLTDRERSHRETGDLYFALFEHTSDMIYTHDLEGRLTSINAAGERLIGKTRDHALRLRLIDLLPPEYHEQIANAIAQHAEGEVSLTVEVEMISDEGRRVPLEIITRSITRGGRTIGVQGIASDINQRRRFDDQLLHLASHDPLTDLFNRRRFEEELQFRIAEARRSGVSSSLLFLDLDHFKDVNDTLGHWAGDELLADVGRMLRERLRETDVVARLGGDEFTVILPHTDLERATPLAGELLGLLRNKTFRLAGKPITITASAGVALIPEHGNTAEESLSHADIAMYQAKEKGRNRVCVFSPDSDVQAKSESGLGWRSRIGEALENDLLVLYAQPIQDLRTNEVSQYELLVRMADRQGSVIDAGTFISTAERYGLIQAVDRWVVRQAIQLASKHSCARRQIVLEVNISGQAFADQELLAMIRGELEATRVDPRNIVFEVTETAAIHNINEARDFVRELRSIGCRFALDDFGVGFSSFHQLKTLDVDYLKIDGSFIEHLATDPVDRHLVKAMVDVARALDKQTIAEFVGDAETMEILKDLGVEYAQGYYVGQPRNASELLREEVAQAA